MKEQNFVEKVEKLKITDEIDTDGQVLPPITLDDYEKNKKLVTPDDFIREFTPENPTPEETQVVKDMVEDIYGKKD